MNCRVWLIIWIVLFLLLMVSIAIDGVGAQPLKAPATVATGSGTIVKPTVTATPHLVYVPLIIR